MKDPNRRNSHQRLLETGSNALPALSSHAAAAQRTSFVIGTARVEQTPVTRSSILQIERDQSVEAETNRDVRTIKNSLEVYDFVNASIMAAQKSQHLPRL